MRRPTGAIPEGSDDYPDIVTAWEKWRIIRSADKGPITTWIMQRFIRTTEAFVGKMWFQDRAALRMFAKENGAGEDDLATIDKLPERCPQRD